MTVKDIKRWVEGVLLFGAALFIFFSLFSYSPYDQTFSFCQAGVPVADTPGNFGGRLGAHLSGFLFFVFGAGAYLVVLFTFLLGWACLWGGPGFAWANITGTAGLLLVCSAFFALRGDGGFSFNGGLVGLLLSDWLVRNCGEKGVYLILGILGIGFIGVGHAIFIAPLKEYFDEYFAARHDRLPIPAQAKLRPAAENVERKQAPTIVNTVAPAPEVKEPVVEEPKKPVPEPPKEKSAPPRPKPPKSDFKLPPLELMKQGSPTQKETKDDLERCAQVIEETISEFGIEGEIVQINQGPRVTMYELQLAPGIPIQKVHKIHDNIAMSLKTTTIRIVAPLPGKSTVGIEVPNRDISVVYLRELLASKEFTSSKSKLTVSIGKDIMGRCIVADLKTMPHLLIAGATGSGKTVCINSLIASILYKATPEEVKFLMIDPKMVELTFYNDLPHLIVPVVIEIKKAVIVLKWLIGEMERRYKLFSQEKVRNIENYNLQHKDDFLPYVVVVVDELADLMIIAKNEIENSIIRLAQLSRAAGIHLILATQRPSVNVITGVIKANLPCRISFQVPSKFDSRTILDGIGAEKLLGRGDLLFIPPGSSRSLRIQGSYVADEEIESICEFFKEQKPADYQLEILEAPEEEEEFGTMSEGEEEGDLYIQAKRIVVETKIASISMIQRRLKIGFNRAARLIEKMEEDGIVGPYREGKPREVLKKTDFE